MSSACSVCSDPFILSNKTCVTQCPFAQYNRNGTCEACSANCERCDSTGCLTCTSPTKLYESACVASCPEHTFLNATIGLNNSTVSDQKCLECYMDCKTCSGPGEGQCRTCDISNPPHAVFLNKTCVASCPAEGYVEDKIAKKCIACGSECLTCSDPQRPKVCTTCPSGTNLFNSTCVATCPVGTYIANGVCESKKYAEL